LQLISDYRKEQFSKIKEENYIGVTLIYNANVLYRTIQAQFNNAL
jgi:hypothetical protein